jgi:hypothetical protein
MNGISSAAMQYDTAVAIFGDEILSGISMKEFRQYANNETAIGVALCRECGMKTDTRYPAWRAAPKYATCDWCFEMKRLASEKDRTSFWHYVTPNYEAVDGVGEWSG